MGCVSVRGALVSKLPFRMLASSFAVAFLLGWFVLVFRSLITGGTVFRGEADDYTAPVASLLNDHDFAISAADLDLYRDTFPEWASKVERFEFSSFSARGGKESLTWYFPVYAIASLPLVILLPKFGIPASYAFSSLNFLMVAIAMAVAWVKLRAPRRSRLLLIALLSIHPVVFYISWASAEVLLYALIVMSLVFWHGNSHGKSAFLMAIAAMLNPALLIASAAIFLDGLRLVARRRGRKPFSGGMIRDFSIILGCSLPGVIPLAYNFHHTGHVNLTAAHASYFAPGTFVSASNLLSLFHRFMAYLFDLNFGFLPYFPVAFPCFLALFAWHAFKKDWASLRLPVVFFAVVAFYSVMQHLNCGMSGIARYNAWSSAFFLFFVCLNGAPPASHWKFRSWSRALAFGLAITGSVIMSYGMFNAERTSWISMTPVAQFALDNVPSLYSPLHSTFFVRTRHEPDGDFAFSTNMPGVEASMPIVYSARDGYVRKVLASAADKAKLGSLLASSAGDGGWLAEKLERLGPQPRYLNFSKDDGLVLAPEMPLGKPVFFQKGRSDGKAYFLDGLSHLETRGTWTNGRRAVMAFKTTSQASRLHVQIDCHFFHHPQPVRITTNGEVAFEDVGGKDGFGFEIRNPGPGRAILLFFDFPEAASPASYGLSMDKRVLALFVKSLVVVADDQFAN